MGMWVIMEDEGRRTYIPASRVGSVGVLGFGGAVRVADRRIARRSAVDLGRLRTRVPGFWGVLVWVRVRVQCLRRIGGGGVDL